MRGLYRHSSFLSEFSRAVQFSELVVLSWEMASRWTPEQWKVIFPMPEFQEGDFEHGDVPGEVRATGYNCCDIPVLGVL